MGSSIAKMIPSRLIIEKTSYIIPKSYYKKSPQIRFKAGGGIRILPRGFRTILGVLKL